MAHVQAIPHPPRDRKPQHRRTVATISARLDMGARIGAWADTNPGTETIKWRAVARDVFNLTPCNAVTQRLRRSYAEWLSHGRSGCVTPAAAGAENREQRRRNSDEASARGRHKGESISFELLQWFVDEVEAIKSRADSRLMLDQARWLKAQLVAAGTNEASLPKINKGWLYRWRQEHGVVMRKGTTHFQVSWAKAVDRVRCMMGNIFRLRRLWDLCHPGVEMRWLSIDQKPSWMNNAGHKPMYARKGARQVAAKENFAATRDRYTILTYVPSWAPPAGSPPPVAVLFRAATGTRLRRDLQHPDWMKLQFQERGSYRSSDVVEALAFGLTPATRSSESVVVLLDWFAAHLTDEVQDAIRGMGHVVLYHGGGVTGLEQVNDTHLHADVQRKLEQLETRMMHQQRAERPEKIASLTRQNVLDVVAEMWLATDHRNVRETGYRQTGPTLPDDAGVDALFTDLRPVWEALNGEALRQEARDTVDELWAHGVLRSWADVEHIIEHHTPHPGDPEGLEAVDWDIGSDGEDDGDDGADDPDDPGGAISASGPSGVDFVPSGSSASSSSGSGGSSGSASGPSGAAPVLSGSIARSSSGSDGSGGNDSSGHSGVAIVPSGGVCDSGGDHSADRTSGSSGPDAPSDGGLCTDPAYVDALRQVVAVARRTRNDVLLRTVLRELRKSTKKESSRRAPEAEQLRTAARQELQRTIAARQERRELERRAAIEDLAAQTALHEAKRLATDSRRQAMNAAVATRREELERQAASARVRRETRWLQTR